jgi:hypothetical protein
MRIDLAKYNHDELQAALVLIALAHYKAETGTLNGKPLRDCFNLNPQ